MARVANGGLAVKPTLIRATATTAAAAAAVARDNTDNAPSAMNSLESLNIPPEHIAVVHKGMWGAVNGGGTAARAALHMTDPDKLDWKMAGKTGSSQTHQTKRSERALGEMTAAKQGQIPWDLRDHALFIAFGPFHAPRYAISCIIEHGKAGVNAAMLVKDVMEQVLHFDPSRKPRVDEVAAAAPDTAPTGAAMPTGVPGTPQGGQHGGPA
jgi:penicillin-binding protein 2